MSSQGKLQVGMAETNSMAARAQAESGVVTTPEDVATLYSWANLHGAKYRDFSASRAQAREDARRRVEEAAQEERRRKLEEEERRAQEELQRAARLAAEAAEAERTAEAERLAEIARQAEMERQAVLAAQEAQRQAALQRASMQSPLAAQQGGLQPEYRSAYEPKQYATAFPPYPASGFAPVDSNVAQVNNKMPLWEPTGEERPMDARVGTADGLQARNGPWDFPAQANRAVPGAPAAVQGSPFAMAQEDRTQTASVPFAAPAYRSHAIREGFQGAPQVSHSAHSGETFGQTMWPLTSPGADFQEMREASVGPAWLASGSSSAPAASPSRQVAGASVFADGLNSGSPAGGPHEAYFALSGGWRGNDASELAAPSLAFRGDSGPAAQGRGPASGPIYGSASSAVTSVAASPAPGTMAHFQALAAAGQYSNGMSGSLPGAISAQYAQHGPNPAPAAGAGSLPGPVDDTLLGSRDRIASRWYALKSVFDPQAGMSDQAQPQPPARVPALAIFSLAGGVGKSSLVASLGRALSARGERVLLVDTAAYGVLPFYFGARDQRPGALRTFNPPGVSADTPIQLVTLDPERPSPLSESSQEQAHAYSESRVGEGPGGPDALALEISRYARGANRVLVDLPTASGATTRRVLRMAPIMLVPVLPDMNSVVSVGAIEGFFRNNSGGGKPNLPFYVLNQFDASLPLHIDVREILREQIGDRLLPFALRLSPTISEALAEGMTVIDYAPTAAVAEDYATLAGWVRSLSAPAMQTYRGVRWSER